MLSRTRFSFVAVAALALFPACDKSSAGSAGASSASASASAASAPAIASSAPASAAPSASAPPALLDKGRGFTSGLVRIAASLPDLTDAQREGLSALDDRLKPPEPDPVHEVMRGLHDDLLAGVRAGKIDAAKLDARYAALDKADAARAEKEAAALTDLHALLQPAQRRGVAAILRKRSDARDAERARPDGGAHDDAAKRRLDGMANDLALDPGQKNAVAGVLAKVPSQDAIHASERARLRAVLAAFEADAFDAKKLDLGVVPGKKAHEAVVPHVEIVTRLVAILLPDQRLRLAASLSKQRGAIGGVGSHDADD